MLAATPTMETYIRCSNYITKLTKTMDGKNSIMRGISYMQGTIQHARNT